MNKQFAFLVLCLMLTGLLFVGGCGDEKIRIEEQIKPVLLRWNLPAEWEEKFDHRVNKTDSMVIDGIGKGGRFDLNIKFMADEKALLEQVNACRKLVMLPAVGNLDLNRENSLEKSFGRLFNLEGMVGEINGAAVQIVENRTIIPIQNKASNLFLSWIKYSDGQYWLIWYADKSMAFNANNGVVGQFAMQFEFPRLSIEEQQELSYSKSEIDQSNMAFVKVLMKEKQAREARGAKLAASSPKGTAGAVKSGAGHVQWDLPKGWVAQPKKMFSFATFHVGGNRDLLVKVSKMGLNFGNLTANINRWRAEVGLSGLNDVSDVESDSLNISGAEATAYRFDGLGLVVRVR